MHFLWIKLALYKPMKRNYKITELLAIVCLCVKSLHWINQLLNDTPRIGFNEAVVIVTSHLISGAVRFTSETVGVEIAFCPCLWCVKGVLRRRDNGEIVTLVVTLPSWRDPQSHCENDKQPHEIKGSCLPRSGRHDPLIPKRPHDLRGIKFTSSADRLFASSLPSEKIATFCELI